MEVVREVRLMEFAGKLFISQMTKEQRKDFALFRKLVKKGDFGKKIILWNEHDLPSGKFFFADSNYYVGIGSQSAYEEFFRRKDLKEFKSSYGLSQQWLKMILETFDGRISSFEFFPNKPACFKLDSKLVLLIAQNSGLRVFKKWRGGE